MHLQRIDGILVPSGFDGIDAWVSSLPEMFEPAENYRSDIEEAIQWMIGGGAIRRASWRPHAYIARAPGPPAGEKGRTRRPDAPRIMLAAVPQAMVHEFGETDWRAADWGGYDSEAPLPPVAPSRRGCFLTMPQALRRARYGERVSRRPKKWLVFARGRSFSIRLRHGGVFGDDPTTINTYRPSAADVFARDWRVVPDDVSY